MASKQQATSYSLTNKDDLKIEMERLKLQASAFFQLELKQILHHKPQITCMLDIGCGNGSYGKSLKANVDGVNIVGVDRNESLLKQARETTTDAIYYQCNFSEEENFKNIIVEHRPDLFIARFVFQHILSTEQISLLNFIRLTKLPQARFLVIDSDDRKAVFKPFSPAISYLLKERGKFQVSQGGDREIGSRLESLMKEQGYTDVVSSLLVLSNKDVGWEMFRTLIWPVIQGSHDYVPLNKDYHAQLIEEGKQWFDAAKENPDYFASVSLFYVSGV